MNTVRWRELGTNGRSSPVLESHTTVDEDPEAGIAMTGVGVHSQHCGRGHQQLDCWAP